MIGQGEVWWAELGTPGGSEAGFRRPVVIVQGDLLNASLVATTVCVPLTSNLRWARAPGNVLLLKRETGLERDSVANVSLILAVDKSRLFDRTGQIARQSLERILAGIDVVLGR